MRLPGAGLPAAIRRRRAVRRSPAAAGPQLAADNDTALSPGPTTATASSAPSDAGAPDTRMDSGAPAASQKSEPGKGRWEVLASQRYAPAFVRRYAQRRLTLAHVQTLVRRYRRRDPDDNRRTRIPEGEQVRFPVIWLTELYTPTTLDGLLEGLPPLLAKAYDPDPGREASVDWVRTSRRQGGGAFRSLPEVLPRAGAYTDYYVVDVLPSGIKAVTWGIYTLTSTVTVVTAAFHVQDEHVDELQRIVNRDVSTGAIRQPDGYAIRLVSQQKEANADQWRQTLRSSAARWLADRLPGSFQSLTPGQLPTIELILTEKLRPWEPAPAPRLKGDWTELLDLEDWEGYWQCIDLPWLRLHERKISVPGGLPLPLQDVLTLAALWGDLPAILTAYAEERSVSVVADEEEARTQNGAILLLGQRVIRFASRYALSVLLRKLDEQLAATRDLSERATSQRSPKALTQVQQQLIHTGLDSQIVAADISRYASNVTRWKSDVLDFTKVEDPGLAEPSTPPLTMAESMRQSQISLGAAVAQAEVDLRDLINSSAQLTATAENIRLQRSVRWLAIISLLVAIIAAAATVAALYISSHPPTPTPTSSHPPTPTPTAHPGAHRT